jgi:hypothetical protein
VPAILVAGCGTGGRTSTVPSEGEAKAATEDRFIERTAHERIAASEPFSDCGSREGTVRTCVSGAAISSAGDCRYLFAVVGPHARVLHEHMYTLRPGEHESNKVLQGLADACKRGPTESTSATTTSAAERTGPIASEPPPSTRTFSGNGIEDIGTLTVSKPAVIHWTAEGESGYDVFYMYSKPTAEGSTIYAGGPNVATGETHVEPGSYPETTVDATGPWRLEVIEGNT